MWEDLLCSTEFENEDKPFHTQDLFTGIAVALHKSLLWDIQALQHHFHIMHSADLLREQFQAVVRLLSFASIPAQWLTPMNSKFYWGALLSACSSCIICKLIFCSTSSTSVPLASPAFPILPIRYSGSSIPSLRSLVCFRSSTRPEEGML